MTAIRRALIVVHGVGDPKEGENLDAMLGSSDAVDSLTEEATFALVEGDLQHPDQYSVHRSEVRIGAIGQDPALFANVHWGDLSSVSRSLVGLVRSGLSAIFGLRYLMVAAARGGSRVESLCRISSYILRGPVVGLNIYLALLYFGVGLSDQLAGEEVELPQNLQLGVLGLLIGGAMAVAWTLLRRTRSRRWRRLYLGSRIWFPYVLGAAATTLILALFAGQLQDSWLTGQAGRTLRPATFGGEEGPAAQKVIEELQAGDAVWHGSLVVSLLQLAWFSLVGVGAAILATHFCTHHRIPKGPRRVSVQAIVWLTLLTTGGWIVAVPTFWTLGNHYLPEFAKPDGPTFGVLFQAAVPLLGTQWLGALFVVPLLVILGGRVLAWRQRAAATDQAPKAGHDPAPRLILSRYLGRGIEISSAVGIVTAFLYTFGVRNAEEGTLLALARPALAKVTLLVLVGVIALGPFVFVFLRTLILTVLDIALDVINHFRTDPLSGEYEIRHAIQGRVQSVVHEITRRYELDELVLVAHSQGTMAVIAALNEEETFHGSVPPRAVTLVTAGSPFEHLYGHYFAEKYPPLDSEHWATLRRRVARWHNAYRTDDYVGTFITGCDDHGVLAEHPADSRFPLNVPLGRGGHINYWTDRRFHRVLSGLLREPIGRPEPRA